MTRREELFFSILTISGINYFLLSSTSIGFIGIYSALKCVTRKYLNEAYEKGNLNRNTANAIDSYTNFFNPIVCETSKGTINKYIDSCELSIVLGLTIAEIYIQLFDRLLPTKYKGKENHRNSITQDTMRKFIYFGSKVLFTKCISTVLNSSGFVPFILGNLLSSFINESMKCYSEKDKNLSKKELITIKAFSAYFAKEIMRPILKPYRECLYEYSFEVTCAGVALNSLHDVFRDGLNDAFQYVGIAYYKAKAPHLDCETIKGKAL